MQKVLIALPLVLASMASAQNQQQPEPAAPPVEVPPPNPPPAPAPPVTAPPAMALPVGAPSALMPPASPGPQAANVVTYVNKTLPPAPAAQQVYPPCSATVTDQCQQREGRQSAARKGPAHRRH
ncbi:MAG: hypothetical protein ACKOW1_02100 [Novosphingobium sp.]